MVSSHQLQYSEPLPLLPVPAQPHPPVSSAPDQLAGSPQPARQHFIDQQIERQPPSHVRAVPPFPPVGPGDPERHAVPAIGPTPRTVHAARITRRATARVHSQPTAVGLGDNQISYGLVPRLPSLVPREIHLHAIRVNVVRLVVQS